MRQLYNVLGYKSVSIGGSNDCGSKPKSDSRPVVETLPLCDWFELFFDGVDEIPLPFGLSNEAFVFKFATLVFVLADGFCAADNAAADGLRWNNWNIIAWLYAKSANAASGKSDCIFDKLLKFCATAKCCCCRI